MGGMRKNFDPKAIVDEKSDPSATRIMILPKEPVSVQRHKKSVGVCVLPLPYHPKCAAGIVTFPNGGLELCCGQNVPVKMAVDNNITLSSDDRALLVEDITKAVNARDNTGLFTADRELLVRAITSAVSATVENKLVESMTLIMNDMFNKFNENIMTKVDALDDTVTELQSAQGENAEKFKSIDSNIKSVNAQMSVMDNEIISAAAENRREAADMVPA